MRRVTLRCEVVSTRVYPSKELVVMIVLRLAVERVRGEAKVEIFKGFRGAATIRRCEVALYRK